MDKKFRLWFFEVLTYLKTFIILEKGELYSTLVDTDNRRNRDKMLIHRMLFERARKINHVLLRNLHVRIIAKSYDVICYGHDCSYNGTLNEITHFTKMG